MTSVTRSSVLESLERIGLDELNASAALQTRLDRKYLVPRDELDAVLAGLASDTRVLEIDHSIASRYESVYFDTPDLASYLTAARRRRRRFKIRTRTYLDSEDCYLEVKTKGGRSLTVKERLLYSIDDRDRLTPDGRRYTDEVLHDAGVDGSGMDLMPTLTTGYARTTLYLPGSGSRATIDTDLTWRLGTGREMRTPRLAVVETKSGSAASAVDRLLWRNGLRPESISKYGVGMAALRPDLPSNKWSRVLRRHFSTTSTSPDRRRAPRAVL